MLRLISLLGLIVLLALGWALSNNRRAFPWRTVLWGLALQFIFAAFILDTKIGVAIFKGAQEVVDQLNVYANEGAKMVFGPLGDAATLKGVFGPLGPERRGDLAMIGMRAMLAGLLACYLFTCVVGVLL